MARGPESELCDFLEDAKAYARAGTGPRLRGGADRQSVLAMSGALDRADGLLELWADYCRSAAGLRRVL